MKNSFGNKISRESRLIVLVVLEGCFLYCFSSAGISPFSNTFTGLNSPSSIFLKSNYFIINYLFLIYFLFYK